MPDWVIGLGIWIAVAVGAVLGARGLDRAFSLFGEYAAGPRAHPDQDPAP